MASFLDAKNQQVILPDNDAPYHAVRIVDFSLKKTNAIQFHDPRSYYPEGYVCHWSPGFDLSLGLLGRFFYSFFPNEYYLKIFICLLPPLLGIITIVAYYFLCIRLMPPVVSLVATIFFSLLPFHITATYFALVDHHAAEYLFIVLLYLAALRMDSRLSLWSTSIIIVAGFWVVPGFVLDYLIFTAACLTLQLFGSSWPGYSTFARRIAIIHTLSALLLIPSPYFTYYGSRFPIRYDSLSFFHGTIVFIGAIATTLVFLFQRHKPSFYHALKGIAVASIFLCLIMLSLPDFRDAVMQGFLFTKGDSYISISKEIGKLSWNYVNAGYLGVLWPFELLGLSCMARAVFKRRDLMLGLFLLPPCIYGLMSLQEVKFFRYFCIFAVAAAFFGLYKLLPLVFRYKRLRPLVVTALVLLLLTAFQDYGKAFHLHEKIANDPLYEVCSFVDQHYERGKNGQTIFAPWDAGHKIIYYTNFYNMDNPFLVRQFAGRTKDFASFYFAGTENDALAILKKYSSKLVIMEPPDILIRNLGNFLGNSFFNNHMPRDNAMRSKLTRSFGSRLYYFDGNTAPAAPDNPAISPFRLVFESHPATRSSGMVTSKYKLYETVPGASIYIYSADTKKGGFPPVLTLTLKTNTGRIFSYKTLPLSQKNGCLKFKVPYAAPGFNGGVLALSPYHIKSEGKIYEIPVSNNDVVEGKSVLLKSADSAALPDKER